MGLSTALVGGGALCAALLAPKFHSGIRMTDKTFVMAESGLPVSLDPLDADYSNNLHASQMVHRSILEVDGENILKSSLLDKFSYNPESREIIFSLKPDEKFSDGSKITIQDLEMSIKRMLLKRPTFPVIRHIEGVEAWTKTRTPLAQKVAGIVTEGNTLRIRLAKAVNTPLFRFALPIFGVVKAECVDLEKNVLRKDCATSGYYTLESTSGDRLRFILNPKVNHSGLPLAPVISIRYIPRSLTVADLAEMKNGNFVALAQEYAIGAADADALAKTGYTRLEQPNSRFSFFMLNPGHSAFANEDCRRIFADTLRAKIVSDSPLVQKENSIFTRILPGYMTREELAKAAPLEPSAEARCKSVFKGKSIRWMASENNNSDAFEKALKEAASALGMAVEVAKPMTTKERYEDFAQGRLDVILAGSGFWAFDPIGDVQMLFTRGLHKPLAFAAADDKLQQLLLGLEFLPDPNERMRAINTHLYRHALFNVYAHAKRVYFIKGEEVSKRIPIAITPPAPWQVFNVAGS